MNKEEKLHFEVCEYIRIKYPNVIFTSDSSGVRVPITVAKKLKKTRSGDKLPDLWIMQPNKTYFGLFIEIKAAEIYKKDGTLKKNEHLEGQAKVLNRLTYKGYAALFGVGFDNCKSIIDNYMSDL